MLKYYHKDERIFWANLPKKEIILLCVEIFFSCKDELEGHHLLQLLA